MDDRRFDAFARSLASASNRRQLLRGLLGFGGVAAAVSLDHAEAARRPTPTPKPIRCPGTQIWADGECVCPDGQVTCGSACCVPGVSECCDNACCFGTCYGEELCCPAEMVVCDGVCRDWECCGDGDCPDNNVCDQATHTCKCVPNCNDVVCGSDGCGGSCGSCPTGQTCTNGKCACITGHLCADGSCYACCVDADCAGNAACNPETHTCQCVPNCTGKTCGGDGCGGQCGTCPEGQICTSAGICGCNSGVLCSDGICHQCCAAADCAKSQGGVAECWKCAQGTCGYYSGFCPDGVCGVSSPDVIGHCVACGVAGNLTGDACSAAVPCCSGYTCDFRYGDQGICRLSA